MKIHKSRSIFYVSFLHRNDDRTASEFRLENNGKFMRAGFWEN